MGYLGFATAVQGMLSCGICHRDLVAGVHLPPAGALAVSSPVCPAAGDGLEVHTSHQATGNVRAVGITQQAHPKTHSSGV